MLLCTCCCCCCSSGRSPQALTHLVLLLAAVADVTAGHCYRRGSGCDPWCNRPPFAPHHIVHHLITLHLRLIYDLELSIYILFLWSRTPACLLKLLLPLRLLPLLPGAIALPLHLHLLIYHLIAFHVHLTYHLITLQLQGTLFLCTGCDTVRWCMVLSMMVHYYCLIYIYILGNKRPSRPQGGRARFL